MRFQKLMPRMGYEFQAHGQTRVGIGDPWCGPGRDRVSLPRGGFKIPPILGGVPPHPKGEGSNPSEIYPCPNISSGNYDIFVIDCPGWGYPPLPGSRNPPFLGGGGGGTPPSPGGVYTPPRRMGLLWRIPPPPPPIGVGGVPPLPPLQDGSQGWGGPMSPRTIGPNARTALGGTPRPPSHCLGLGLWPAPPEKGGYRPPLLGD